MEESLKRYIVSLKRTHASPLPKGRRAAIQAMTESFEKSRIEVFQRLGALGYHPVQQESALTVFTAEGGVRFTCFPALSTFFALVPEKVAEALRKDPLVSMVTEDQNIRLQPCEG